MSTRKGIVLDIQLTSYEVRVIGSLIEKEITTPDQYPLSLNALTNACNQKSSRDPVLNLDEGTVQDVVDGLIKKRLVSEKTGFGSRVAKYQHRFCNTDFGDLKLSAEELGIMCVLMLRGPQTPGELRTRTERLCKYGDVERVETVLKLLIERADGPFVIKLPREAGKRESRYAHLFSGEVQISSAAEEEISAGASSIEGDRLAKLENALQELRREIDEIKGRLDRSSANH
jgi:uncharacterized protein YceH (UPF0502 family)